MPTYAFQPDYAVAPGDTLRELLEERGMPQSELALRTGLAEKTISQIANGTAPLSYETASKLEMALDVPASFWNNLESQYREKQFVFDFCTDQSEQQVVQKIEESGKPRKPR